MLPPQLACVVTLRSSLAPPRIRGRTYLPPAVESVNQADGTPSATHRSNVLTACTNQYTGTLTVTVGAHTATLLGILWSKKLSSFYALDQLTVRTAWGTQRRRSGINRGDQSAI
jgi:hypothetical protein